MLVNLVFFMKMLWFHPKDCGKVVKATQETGDMHHWQRTYDDSIGATT